MTSNNVAAAMTATVGTKNMKLKIAITALALVLAAPSAFAACYGSGAYRTCTDSSGNTYSTSRSSSSSYTNGYNSRTGSSWGQQTYRSGGSSTTYGTDKRGRSYTNSVNRSGGTTTYSGTNSKGKSYYKTCTSLGCF